MGDSVGVRTRQRGREWTRRMWWGGGMRMQRWKSWLSSMRIWQLDDVGERKEAGELMVYQ